MKKMMKNIEPAQILDMEQMVEYRDGQVVSKTLSQNKAVSLTLFAFDKNEEIGTHASGGDALVYLLDGEAKITIEEEEFFLKKGETILMPAGKPHSLWATERFKMVLIVVFPEK